MKLQQLIYVRALSEELSFHAAASRCAVSQPTMSAAIAQLESELGNRLFERSTRYVKLSSFGQAVMPAVCDILAAVDRLRELSARYSEQAGLRLHVGLSPTVGLRRAADLLRGFAEAYVNDVGIVYHEENVESLFRLLQAGSLDIVIAPAEPFNLDRSQLAFTQLRQERLFFLPQGGTFRRWAGKREVMLEEIANLEFIMIPDSCGLSPAIQRLFAERKLKMRCYPGVASNHHVVQEWVSNGLGSGILPESQCSFGQRGRLAIPVVDNGKPLTIDYVAFGRPGTVSAELFNAAWKCLIETEWRLEPTS